MRNGKDLIGRPVVIIDNHVEIERIEGLVLDPSETLVTALVVKSDERFRQARVLPLHLVKSFGPTEITVSSARAIHTVDQVPDIRRIRNWYASSSDTRLTTLDGSEDGIVCDLIFDEKTGNIDSFFAENLSDDGTRLRNPPLHLYDELDFELIVHITEVKQLERHEKEVAVGVTDSDEMALSRANDDGMPLADQKPNSAK